MNETASKRRFTEHREARPGAVVELEPEHVAIRKARSLYPSTVTQVADSPRLLVSGANQRKIGDRVTKGAWKGMPIFCLTLEERATCPRSCHQYLRCYGNAMHLSRRHVHGAPLEARLAEELEEKQNEHPEGFVLRLHILGDFYDLAYTALWVRWMATFPALHVFGFTAREETSDEGILIRMLNRDYGERWVIRFSTAKPGATAGVRYATVVDEQPEGPTVDGAVICPAQTGQTACCGSCGFCWAGTKAVAFVAHGKHLVRVRRAPLRPKPPALPPMPRKNARSYFSANLFDPFELIPLSEAEIREWVTRAGMDAARYPTPAKLLHAANLERDKHDLPHFRIQLSHGDRP